MDIFLGHLLKGPHESKKNSANRKLSVEFLLDGEAQVLAGATFGEEHDAHLKPSDALCSSRGEGPSEDIDEANHLLISKTESVPGI